MEPLSKREASNGLTGTFRLVELSLLLIEGGLRYKMVNALTGISQSKLKVLLRESTARAAGPQTPPPKKGPVPQRTPESFCGRKWRYDPTANLHSTLFIASFQNLSKLFGEPMHEAFLFLQAFRFYRAESVRLGLADSRAAYDINQAYWLYRYVVGKEIRLVKCRNSDCGVEYAVVTTYETQTQPCPVCAKKQLVAHCSESLNRARQLKGTQHAANDPSDPA